MGPDIQKVIGFEGGDLIEEIFDAVVLEPLIGQFFVHRVFPID